MPTDVRAISFDIWKTLLNGNTAFTRPRLELIFRMLGVQIVDIEAVVAVYKRSNAKYDGLMEETGHDFGFFPRLAYIFAELKIQRNLPNDSEVVEIQQALGQLRCNPEYMPPLIEPDLLRTLELLKIQGYRLGLLSNTGLDDQLVMEPVLRKLGIWDLVDAAVFTSEIGIAKPGPETFMYELDKLGVQVHQALHVGDNTNADYRAHEAGLHAVMYAPKGIEGYPFIRSMKELLGK